jgi:hypothetical protein
MYMNRTQKTLVYPGRLALVTGPATVCHARSGGAKAVVLTPDKLLQVMARHGLLKQKSVLQQSTRGKEVAKFTWPKTFILEAQPPPV